MGIGAAEQQAHRQTTGARTHRGETLAAGGAADAIPVAVANSRLTAILDLTLLILFALQVVTVLAGVRSVLTWHVVLGLILLPPVGLKLTSVTWRMVSYHRGRDGFRRHHPTAAGAAGSGPVPRQAHRDPAGQWHYPARRVPGWAQSPALLVHQVSFYAWLAAAVVHIVPHSLQAVHLARRDWARRVGGARRVGEVRSSRRAWPPGRCSPRCSPAVHPTTCSTFPSHELQVRPATTARPAGQPGGGPAGNRPSTANKCGSGIVEQCGC